MLELQFWILMIANNELNWEDNKYFVKSDQICFKLIGINFRFQISIDQNIFKYLRVDFFRIENWTL